MILTTEQRNFFEQLCGVLLPAWEQFPDGSQLQLQNSPLDAALNIRPELSDPLFYLAGKVEGGVDLNQVMKMRKDYPSEFNQLKLLVYAVYFQHSRVRSALRYDGQQALTLPRGGFGCEELVINMMSGAKRYRDTDSSV